jgi:hypothetical protein
MNFANLLTVGIASLNVYFSITDGGTISLIAELFVKDEMIQPSAL